jgi:Tol biopolymer transport system component/DNA-binding winged helix-turn-helix (wHTH) protein
MSGSKNHLYEFGPFRLDPEQRCLVRDGCFVPLTPKAFELLLVLVRMSGRVVGKDELMKEVWPNTFVEEGNLTQHIFALRKALGESHNEPQYIETIPRRGYRFAAGVLDVRDTGTSYVFETHTEAKVITDIEQEMTHEGAIEQTDSSDWALSEEHSGQVTFETARGSTAPVFHLKHLISAGKRWRRFSTIFLASLIAVVAVFIFGLYRSFDRKEIKPAALFDVRQAVKITNTGNVTTSAISRDGKLVAYAIDDNGKQSLWLRQATVASQSLIAAPAEVNYIGITFSTDDDYIFYVVYSKSLQTGLLYQVPVLGGDPRQLSADVGTPVTFSPDGKRIAFVRANQASGEDQLMVANADGTGARKLAVRKFPGYGWFPHSGPTWSPDGKVIACIAASVIDGVTNTTVIAVRVKDGEEKPITTQNWEYIGQITWISDGSGLLMTARDHASAFYQIWQLSYPGGGVRSVTSDLNDYWNVSLSADSRILATVQRNQLYNIWLIPFDDLNHATQVTSGASTYFTLSWTPDGEIVYDSAASGNADIWMMKDDGKVQKQLTADVGKNYASSVSADGRYIVFHSNRSGTYHVWRMNVDGSNPIQLTRGTDEALLPQISPDSRWVIYQSGGNLWRVPIDGGEPVRLTDKQSARAVFSPDGKLIACWYWDTPGTEQPRLAIIHSEGGQPVRLFDSPPGVILPIFIFPPTIRWAQDGRALEYIGNKHDVSNIWVQPLDGSPAQQLTKWKSDRIVSFAWSPGGKQLAVSRGFQQNDLVLINDLR